MGLEVHGGPASVRRDSAVRDGDHASPGDVGSPGDNHNSSRHHRAQANDTLPAHCGRAGVRASDRLRRDHVGCRSGRGSDRGSAGARPADAAIDPTGAAERGLQSRAARWPVRAPHAGGRQGLAGGTGARRDGLSRRRPSGSVTCGRYAASGTGERRDRPLADRHSGGRRRRDTGWGKSGAVGPPDLSEADNTTASAPVAAKIVASAMNEAAPSPAIAETPVVAASAAAVDCEAWNTWEFFRTAAAADVSACLAAGADLEVRDDDHGRTPLHRATLLSNRPAVIRLLAAEADVNARDDQGLSPGLSPLNAASTDDRGERGTTVLPTLVEALLATGTDPTVRDGLGATPLHFVAADHADPTATETPLGVSDARLGVQMDTDAVRRLNYSSPSRLNRRAQRTDFFHGLLGRPSR